MPPGACGRGHPGASRVSCDEEFQHGAVNMRIPQVPRPMIMACDVALLMSGRWPDRNLDHAGGSLDPGTGGTTGMIQLTARGPGGGAHGCINRRRPSLRQVYALPPGRRSRSCGEQLRGEQMSGSQQRPDPKLCWNCGNRGVPGVGSRMTCPECEVTWMPWSSAARGDPEKVCWEGAVIFCVDFSRPGALGAPA
jgi:hypothetical protein